MKTHLPFVRTGLMTLVLSLWVVVGIAAMLLEKNPNQTAMQARSKVIQGTEQVGGYTYSSGISQELGHGRVNCGNSLNLVTTSLSQQAGMKALEIAHLSDRWRISYEHPIPGGQLQLCNLMGQVLENKRLTPAQSTTDWPQIHLAPGLCVMPRVAY